MESECSFWNRRDLLKVGGTSAATRESGWLATPDLISRVLERCIGEQMCAQLRQIADQAKPGSGPYPISSYRSGRNESYHVAQYKPKSLELLEAKIARFPRGARFSLKPTSPQNQDQNSLENQVKTIFEMNGVILLPAAVAQPN